MSESSTSTEHVPVPLAFWFIMCASMLGSVAMICPILMWLGIETVFGIETGHIMLFLSKLALFIFLTGCIIQSRLGSR